MGKVYFIRKNPEDALEENRKVLEEIKRAATSSVMKQVVKSENKVEEEPDRVDLSALSLLDEKMPEFRLVSKVEDSQVNLGALSTDKTEMKQDEISKLGKALKVKKGK